MAESDFSRPFIIGYGSSPSRCGPERRTAAGQTWDLPVPVQGASAHARFFDHAGPFGPCDGASETCCLPHSKQRRHPGLAFAAQWLAYALPYRRFVGVLTDANARLGADVDRSGRTEARTGLPSPVDGMVKEIKVNVGGWSGQLSL